MRVLALLLLPPLQACAVQMPGLALPDYAAQQRETVKAMFIESYKQYSRFAWAHDDLQPESLSYKDSRNGWGASIVDSMSTMHIMGLEADLERAIAYATKIDFTRSKTSDTVSVFETTIRYMAGLLSVYELRGERLEDRALVDKAREVADKLAFAWVGDNDIPYGHIDFANDQPTTETSNIAEAGTLILEWATLSKHLNDSKYAGLAEKSFRHIIAMDTPLPGMPAQDIDPSTGQAVGGLICWDGGSDSYFEYLLKYARLFNPEDPIFVDAWITAIDSSITTLLHRSTVGNHLYTARYNSVSRSLQHASSHLACFHGGNWLYGGTLLKNDTIVSLGLDLIDACWNTYSSTATGIGPDEFAFDSVDGGYATEAGYISPEQTSFYSAHGFYVTSAYYLLRPEVLESNFYAWRITGDVKYVDRARDFVGSVQRYLKGRVAYDGLVDVMDARANGRKINDMESFWFAEVLKYLYLTFDDPAHVSIDDYVFNTEAHPFKAPPEAPWYGSGNFLPHRSPHSTSDEAPPHPMHSGMNVPLR
ncbi:glycoside hydrolase family 47 protein [Hymenopellis radicata]|nr:glycoside hydrolase family 47 protein [Hymenopellis radicata]